MGSVISSAVYPVGWVGDNERVFVALLSIHSKPAAFLNALRRFIKLLPMIFVISGGGYLYFKSGLLRSVVRELRLFWDAIRTVIIGLLSKKFEDKRRNFTELEFGELNERDNHSHARAAAIRNIETGCAENLAVTNRTPSFYVSCAKRDMNAGRLGNRFYFVAKDLALDPKIFHVPTQGHLVVHQDVEFYYQELLDNVKGDNDHLILTFQPDKLGCESDEEGYSFHFRDDKMVMQVRGGEKYEHTLWNWWEVGGCLVLGDVLVKRVYLVERRRSIDQNRMLIFLNLIRKVYFPATLLIDSPTVNRLKVKFGNVNWLPVLDERMKVQHNLSLNGYTTQEKISDECFQTAIVRCKFADAKHLLPATVERIFNEQLKERVSHANAANLFIELYPFLDYNEIKGRTITLRDMKIRKSEYYFPGPLINDDGQGGMRKLFEPISGPAVSPLKGYNADVNTIENRQEKARPRNDVIIPEKFKTEYLLEFTNFMLDGCESLVPYELDEVKVRQPRPSQKRLLEQNELMLCIDVFLRIKSFQKKEAYGKICPPRNINTTTVDHKVILSEFAYPFYDEIMSKMPWYAFGKTPEEIAQAVSDLASRVERICGTDFSRFEATTVQELAVPFCVIMLLAFNPRYREELAQRLSAEFYAPATTYYGVSYNTMFDTVSGSSITALRNSTIVAYISYCAFRELDLEPEVAWNKLGMYGGDDGLNDADVQESFINVSKIFGTLVKEEIFEFNCPVLFLGRYFLNPWVNTDSICDVKRQLDKLHLTTACNDIPLDICLVRKAIGYAATEIDTPILSNWAKNVLMRFQTSIKKTEELGARAGEISWWAGKGKFPNSGNLRDVAFHIVANQYGLSADDVVKYNNYVLNQDPLKLKVFCMLDPLKIEIPVVHDGEIKFPNVKMAQQDQTKPVRKTKPVKILDKAQLIEKIRELEKKPNSSATKVKIRKYKRQLGNYGGEKSPPGALPN